MTSDEEKAKNAWKACVRFIDSGWAGYWPLNYNGKISSSAAIWHARKFDRKTYNDLELSILNYDTSKDASNNAVTPANKRFRELVFMLRHIHNAGGSTEYLEKIKSAYTKKGAKDIYSSENELFVEIIGLLSVKSHYDSFFGELKKREKDITNKYLLFDAPYVQQEGFLWELIYVDDDKYKSAKEYLKVLSSTFGPVERKAYVGRAELFPGKIGNGLWNLIGELDSDMNFKWDYLLNEQKDVLKACYNSFGIAVNNKVGCCITSPNGKSREASALYALDKAVHTWSFSFGNNHSYEQVPPFAMAIFIEAEGRHVSNPDDKKRYLILEGFPANQEYYERMGKLGIKGLCKYPELDFSTLVYVLGLQTALHSNIPKLFVNANHSDAQKSVQDAVRTAAKEYKLPREYWRMGNHGFKLLKDPQSGEDFACISANVKRFNKETKKLELVTERFEYTHFLKKPELPPAVIKLVRRDPDWNGEIYSDTWYREDEFIGKTYSKWSDEAKRLHSHAEVIWARIKERKNSGLPQESYWNLGTGYCKGFEVDVEKECKRLGIS